MNPFEWLATILWDPSGKRRRAQLMRFARSRRTVSEYERVNQRAAEQIRRLQRVASVMGKQR